MKKIFYVAVLLLVVAGACNTQKMNLALNLEPNETYSQVMTAKSTIEQSAMGQKMEIDMEITSGHSYSVKGKEDDNFIIDVVYDSMRMHMNSDFMEMHLNSEALTDETGNSADPMDSVNRMMNKILKSMTGNAFTIVMNPKGKVEEVRNIENLYNNITESFGEAFDEAQLEQFKQQMSQSFGADAFSGNLEMASAIFPEEPVEVGDVWQVETELITTVQAKVVTTYELMEVTDGAYIVHGDAEITSSNEAFETNGMSMTYNLNGSMTSDLKVDKKTGWVLEGDIKQIIEGEAKAEGMAIPMKITTEMEIRGI